MDIVFSGVQPTGTLHLGNYLGAILSWKKFQSVYDLSFFSVVDLHAITVPYNKNSFTDNVFHTIAQYFACGIDPNYSNVFIQSHIKEHVELCWMFSTMTPISWMNKMIQFRDKAKNSDASSALFMYPILMAADILLYKANKVPVGEDQIQHLELTKDIAKKFNRLYDVEYFPLPCPLSTIDQQVRIMSLRDPTKKMSKSDPNESSRINLLDSPDVIAKKIKTANTDSILGFEKSSLPNRPAALNLINIYCMITGFDVKYVENNLTTFAQLKSALTEALIEFLSSIRTNFDHLIKDKAFIEKSVHNGTEKAYSVASTNILKIKQIMGFIK